jgi:hypothetical protein
MLNSQVLIYRMLIARFYCTKRDSVTPLIRLQCLSTQDSRPDQLSKDPTEIDVGCEVGPKLCRAHLRGIGCSESLEDTPRNSAKNFAHF